MRKTAQNQKATPSKRKQTTNKYIKMFCFLSFLCFWRVLSLQDCHQHNEWEYVLEVRDSLLLQGVTNPLFQNLPLGWTVYYHDRTNHHLGGYLLLPDGCPCLSFFVDVAEPFLSLDLLHSGMEVDWALLQMREDEASWQRT
jgi:hypothetical protein